MSRGIAGKLLKKTFFLFHTTAEEIEDVIKTFNLKKAIGPNSIPVIIPKEISEPSSTLINLSFDTGDFRNCLKLAKVIPVYNKGDQ